MNGHYVASPNKLIFLPVFSMHLCILHVCAFHLVHNLMHFALLCGDPQSKLISHFICPFYSLLLILTLLHFLNCLFGYFAIVLNAFPFSILFILTTSILITFTLLFILLGKLHVAFSNFYFGYFYFTFMFSFSFWRLSVLPCLHL